MNRDQLLAEFRKMTGVGYVGESTGHGVSGVLYYLSDQGVRWLRGAGGEIVEACPVLSRREYTQVKRSDDDEQLGRHDPDIVSMVRAGCEPGIQYWTLGETWQRDPEYYTTRQDALHSFCDLLATEGEFTPWEEMDDEELENWVSIVREHAGLTIRRELMGGNGDGDFGYRYCVKLAQTEVLSFDIDTHEKHGRDQNPVSVITVGLPEKTYEIRVKSFSSDFCCVTTDGGNTWHHTYVKEGSPASSAGIELLLREITSPEVEKRRQAARSLLHARSQGAVLPLIKALEDKDSEVRHYAAWALGWLRAKPAVDPLLKILHDEVREVREYVIFALGQIRDKRAIKELEKCAEEEDDLIREAAKDAIYLIRTGNDRIFAGQ
jgi:hypothetical protein